MGSSNSRRSQSSAYRSKGIASGAFLSGSKIPSARAALIFFAMTVRVLRSPKADARRNSALPLEDGTALINTPSTTNAPEPADA